MLKLAKAGNAKETDTALGANQTTRSFDCHGTALIRLEGDFSNQTVTVQSTATGSNGSFSTHVYNNAGTPTNLTYTVAMNDAIYSPGQTLRFTCSNGGTPDIDIFVSGDVTLN